MSIPMTPITPIEAREEVVRGIRRRLIGPLTNAIGDRKWPGHHVTGEIVDNSFHEPKTYPYGPWATPQGEEVLPRSPLFVYPVANLGPAMSQAVAAEVLENGERLLVDANDDATASGNDPVADIDGIGSGQGLDDDDAAGADGGQAHILGAAQQSVGFSIRVPLDVTSLEVSLTGGVYHELPVAGQVLPWWRRTDESAHVTLRATESNSESFSLGSVNLKVGVDVRPQTDGTVICTVWARNTCNATNVNEATRMTLFQTCLSATLTQILPYEALDGRGVDSLDLLYSNVMLRSVGHGCDSVVEDVDGRVIVRTDHLPVVNLPGLTPDIKRPDGSLHAVGMLDLANMNEAAVLAVNDIIGSYREWIEKRRGEIQLIDPRFVAIATANIDRCSDFLHDIETGWRLVNSDPVVRQSLCDASLCMNNQRIAANSPVRTSRFDDDGNVLVDGSSPHTGVPDFARQSTWRPFQIAFILSGLNKITDPQSERRNEVDVIWMPTGGGKTEAYLGLSAFTILWEKATQVISGRPAVRNTTVFMRYTLRLLTVQQITRAASLICALELLRQQKTSSYGNEEIRIGAWLGSSVTANSRKNAVSEFKHSVDSDEPLKSILRRCPWCGSAMGATSSRHSRAIGYRIVAGHQDERVLAACPDPACPFTHRIVAGNKGQTIERGIPLFEVDDDVYAGRPDFVVGTIDKVARIGWVPRAERLFGLHKGRRDVPPPSLFIQDELHLIAGPLGSIDGSFEAMLEHLCEFDGGQSPVIVAATATTKNFESQVSSLYARSSRVVPPPGLSIDDSFFARRDETAAGKVYVGVCSTSNFFSTSKLQSLVLAMLSHQAAALEGIPANPDPYWSNVVFFSSRRSLGLLTSAVETTFRSYLNLMHALSGIKTGSKAKDGTQYNTRTVGRVRELTATSSEDVSKVLDDLSIDKTREDSIGLCFATSMVEVGLDVPRLGLMTVMGQPKSASQYIQVTGRVGRSNSAPGLVVTVLNSRTPRDRSHYEGFRVWHERLYASVESTSVTPFTARALERSLASVIVAMGRILGSGNGPQETLTNYWYSALGVIQSRAALVDPRSTMPLARVSQALFNVLTRNEVSSMKWTTEDNGPNTPFIYPMGAVPADRLKEPSWQMLNSMRSVDQDASVKTIAVGVVGDPVAPTEADEDTEEL
jgi:hypothetical protein